MSKYSIHITPRHRLDVKLVKPRGAAIAEPLIPSIKMLRSLRRGSKVSRFFRHIFEQKRVKRLLGSNIALIIIASSFLPTQSQVENLEAQKESTIIAEEKVDLSTKRSVVYPVKKVIVSQGYHIFHPGIDLDGITGDPINPIMDGVVIKVQYSRFAYGNMVIIKHKNNLTSLYAHLSKINVQKDQVVTTFTKIGEMGSTGRAFGDHLHLEIRENGYPINPGSVLPIL